MVPIDIFSNSSKITRERSKECKRISLKSKTSIQPGALVEEIKKKLDEVEEEEKELDVGTNINFTRKTQKSQTNVFDIELIEAELRHGPIYRRLFEINHKK